MRFLSLLIFCCLSLFLSPEIQAYAVKGKIIEFTTGDPAAGSVVTLSDEADKAVRRTAADAEGLFSIDIPQKGTYTLTVELTGCIPYRHSGIKAGGKDEDLGVIELHSNDVELDEVVVSAERGKVIYKLDRRKIDARANLTASAGTATDLLKSMPSVNIDSDGSITLRGSSGFLVYVDGKKSMLEGTEALNQIPASSIENVEIITTPSARYRTDGDVGIINITTRKDNRRGFSATAGASYSTMNAYNFDLTLSYINGPSRWYIGGIANKLRNESDFLQTKETLVDNYLTVSRADGTRYTAPTNYIGSAGWELDTKHHKANIEIQHGRTKTDRGGHMLYDEHRELNGTVLSDNTFNAHDKITNTKHLFQVSAAYAWILNDRGDRIDANARMRYDWDCLEYTESNLFDMNGTRYEGTRGYESEHHWDADGSVTYRMNYSEQGHFEAGYQYTTYSEHGDYSIKYWDRDKVDFDWQDDLYAPFYYRRQIHSLYAMLNQKAGKVEFDAGLRGDYTIDELTIAVKNADRYIKRKNLFPSAHILYRVTDNSNLSAGYSYRVVRPGIWQLEPYITYEDYYTKLIGNPDIRPSYVHSAEIGYNHVFGNNSVTATAFVRRRSDVAQRVRIPYEPGVTLDSLINAGNDLTFGLELSARARITPWWSANLNASIFKYRFTAKYEGCHSDSNLSYSAGLINNFTIDKRTKVQFDANFVGPAVLSQGREKAYCYFDLAVRREVLAGKLWASLVVNNVFHTARYNSHRITDNLKSYTNVKPKFPNIALALSFNFNSTFKESEGKVTSGAQFTGFDF